MLCNHVPQALSLLASYLGYSGRRQFLEDMLVSLLKGWMAEGQPLLEFPTKLFDFETPKDFFKYIIFGAVTLAM